MRNGPANPAREVSSQRLLTLKRAYYLTDVLLLYTLLLVAAGPVLARLARGGTWRVLAATWAVWALRQISPGHAQIPWPITDNSAFLFSAWQVCFFTALVIGYHRQTLVARLRRIPMRLSLAISGVLLAGLVIAYATHAPQPGTTTETDAARLVGQIFYNTTSGSAGCWR